MNDNMKTRQKDSDPRKEMLKYMVKNMYDIAMQSSKSLAVEAIQKVISDGIFDPKELVAELNLDESVVFTALSKSKYMFLDTRSEERKRFDENIKKAFKDEQYFASSYDKRFGSEYIYRPASEIYSSLFYKIYQHLSGKPYKTADQLMKNMHSALKQKRILELGCGPGFVLPLLNRLGAKATGVEQIGDHKGMVRGADIRYGDARFLNHFIDHESFDIIISRDFLTDKILSKANALCVMIACTNVATRGGMGIHQMVYETIHPDTEDFYAWLASRNGGPNYDEYKQYVSRRSEEEKACVKRTNEPALSENDLQSLRFDVAEYAAEAGYFNIVLKNPQ